MTPELQPLPPDERAAMIGRLEVIVDARLEGLATAYQRRWSGLPPSVHDWLTEMLVLILLDMRRELLAVAHDLLPPARVH